MTRRSITNWFHNKRMAAKKRAYRLARRTAASQAQNGAGTSSGAPASLSLMGNGLHQNGSNADSAESTNLTDDLQNLLMVLQQQAEESCTYVNL